MAWCAILGAAPACGQDTTPWVAGLHSAARLIDAGPFEAPGAPAQAALVGVEIRLDPAFLTYWRWPGEAGVPPTFDFGASENVADALVGFPAPGRYDEGGVEAFGYRDEVTFPVKVAPRDPRRPMVLDLSLAYAVCANICLPGAAHLRLPLGGISAPEAGVVRSALARVPVPRKLGEEGPLRIASARPAGKDLVVAAQTPDGTGTLFAEAPDGWDLEAGPGRALGGGQIDFPVTVLERPAGGDPAVPVRLTLSSGAEAIEVTVPLDAIRLKP